MEQFRATTIVAVKKDGKTALAGDGQVTLDKVVSKGNARKVRRIFNDKVVIGFAGGAADAFALENRFEELLQKFSGNLMRSAVELAISFRDDKFRKLEAFMIVADKNNLLMVSGNGDIIEPENGVLAIGSGGSFAQAAALALLQNTDLSAAEIAVKSINIAADICIYTNHHITCEEV